MQVFVSCRELSSTSQAQQAVVTPPDVNEELALTQLNKD